MIPADCRVAVRLERFDGVPKGRAVLRATWVLFGGDPEKVLAMRSSRIEEAVRGDGYGPLVEAQSRLLDALSSRIAATVKQSGPAGDE